MDVLAYNRDARDRQAEKGNRWTVPVGPDAIAAARRGDWQVLLTPARHPSCVPTSGGGGEAVRTGSSAMNETRSETEAEQVEVINTGEELLLKARATARIIEQRVWRAMDEHAPGAPHRPVSPGD